MLDKLFWDDFCKIFKDHPQAYKDVLKNCQKDDVNSLATYFTDKVKSITPSTRYIVVDLIRELSTKLPANDCKLFSNIILNLTIDNNSAVREAALDVLPDVPLL